MTALVSLLFIAMIPMIEKLQNVPYTCCLLFKVMILILADLQVPL